ncbi:Glutamate-Rich Protein 2 [Manis pentadactyla]|nr:Glutamate-Rich Protein 2 [Manis pentadactyla]
MKTKELPSSFNSVSQRDNFRKHSKLLFEKIDISILQCVLGKGKVGKDAIIVEKEENNEYCLQDIDKLSNTTTDDGEEDSSDEDSDDDSDPHKETPAPLELMAEFLRAEMGQDYHLAKKLCEMILIYEPENPEAKEFFSLIEEMLLMEKAQNLEEDDEDSDEDRGGESEGESSKDLSEESADESS